MYEIIRITVMNNRAWTVIESPYPTIRELIGMSYDGFIDYQEIGNPVTRQVLIKDIPYLSIDLDTAIDTYLASYAGPLNNESYKRSTKNPKAIRYIDFWNYGYKAERGCWALGKGVSNPDGNHEDIFITKNSAAITPANNVNNLLYLVNGKAFIGDAVGDDIYLRKAYYRLNKKDRRAMGIIDFTAVGGFQYETITADMLTVKESNMIYSVVNIRPTISFMDYYLPDQPNVVIKHEKLIAGDYWVFVGTSKVPVTSFSLIVESQKDIYETINNVNTVVCPDEHVKRLYKRLSKAVFLIIHGHLFELEKGYVIGDDGLIQVKLFHKTIIGMSDTPFEERSWIKPANGSWTGFDINTLDIEEYILSDTSVILTVDNDRLAIHEEFLQSTAFSGEYLHYRAPNGILYQGDGSIGEYILRDWDYDLVALSVSEPRIKDNIMNTVHSTQISVGMNINTVQPKMKRSARMIDYYFL